MSRSGVGEFVYPLTRIVSGLSVDVRRQILTCYSQGEKLLVLSDRFGVSLSVIFDVCCEPETAVAGG
jgi:hypothetical protein